jgi:hypothetical protein
MLALLKAIADGKFPAADLGDDRQRRLLESDSEAVRTAARTALK